MKDGAWQHSKLDGVCFKSVRYMAWLLCLGGFLWNVWYTVGSYFKYERILKGVEIDVEDGSLEFPSIAICSSRPFKEPIQMVTLEDYENNTFNPNDFIVGVKLQKLRTVGTSELKPVSLPVSVYHYVHTSLNHL